MKLNQAELDAVTWKIVQELRDKRTLAVKVARNKAKQEFEQDTRLKHAWDVLKSDKNKPRYNIELTFLHPKIVDVPAHYEIKSRLIISQIGNNNIAQVITGLTSEIAEEIGLTEKP